MSPNIQNPLPGGCNDISGQPITITLDKGDLRWIPRIHTKRVTYNDPEECPQARTRPPEDRLATSKEVRLESDHRACRPGLLSHG